MAVFQIYARYTVTVALQLYMIHVEVFMAHIGPLLAVHLVVAPCLMPSLSSHVRSLSRGVLG
jgi:hypothetical protein